MKKKLLAVTLAAAMTASLTACGGSGGDGGDGGDGGAKASDGGVSITVFNSKIEVQAQFEEMAKEYSEATGVDVEVYYSNDTVAAHLATKYSSNDPYTLSMVDAKDVYSLAEALLSQDDVKLLEKKDYIANPKPNGYRSLHMIVGIPIFLAHEKRMMKVEIQLRTIAMDFWASLEHQLRYKKDNEFTDEMAEELYQCGRLSADLDRRMDKLRKQTRM